MKLPASIGCLLVACLCDAQVQTTPPPLPQLPATYLASLATTGKTSISLEPSTAATLRSHITTPLGETLQITGPEFGGRPLQWIKNGRELPGATGRQLTLRDVRPGDAGIYLLVVPDTPVTLASQSLDLGVGPTKRLLNISARGLIAPGVGQRFTTGFVVAAGERQGKTLLLRAVGPSLAAFGVAAPLRAPVLRIFDSTGKEYSADYVYPLKGEPTGTVITMSLNIPEFTPEEHRAYVLAASGAFPLPAGSLDVTAVFPFKAGAYTAQVTSADNTGG
jgi:hypothetical protein